MVEEFSVLLRSMQVYLLVYYVWQYTSLVRDFTNCCHLHTATPFKPPAASHFCRCVLNETVRNVVPTQDKPHANFCQVEAVLNSRPITKVSDDVIDAEVLNLNHFLTLGQM